MTIRMGLAATFLSIGAAAAIAQNQGARTVASPSQPAPCAAERAWLATEETTPGILQHLARSAVADCEARLAATAAPVAQAGR